MKRRLISALLLTTLSLAACNDSNAARRHELGVQLENIQSSLSLASNAVAQERNAIAGFNQAIAGKKAEMSEYRSEMEAYFLNHKMALAAIAAGVIGPSVAMDANNEFSDEMSVAGGVAAAIAAFWALGNMDEVVEVADKMIQADAHIKSMEQDIAQLEQGAAQRMPVLRSKEQALAALQKDYEGVRSELSSLGGES